MYGLFNASIKFLDDYTGVVAEFYVIDSASFFFFSSPYLSGCSLKGKV